ncbi:MAG TPA: tetratricopeptide repeat protein, partial [Candidatus Obscuribacterales bacterium]
MSARKNSHKSHGNRSIFLAVSAMLSLSSVVAPAIANGNQDKLLLAAYSQSDEEAIERTYNKVNQLLKARRAQEAKEILLPALARYPQCAELHFQLGNALLDTEQYQKAVDEYQQALRLKTPFPEAVLNIGYAYVNGGAELMSIPWFHRYLRENPNAPDAKDVQAEVLMAHAKAQMKERRFFDAK